MAQLWEGANTVELSSAGQIRTNTSAGSKAGDITLKMPNSLTLSDFRTAVLAQTENTSTSDGGNIFVIGSPKNVLIQNGAELSVNSKGSGIGGDIFLQGYSLTLDHGTISAETKFLLPLRTHGEGWGTHRYLNCPSYN
ncbi:hypothetical protein [Nostoc sp.]|uniref:hypothetical protein n=1 Tax=Nostoc sp. TaxID=1180 RepID=UPI002FF911AE